MSEADWQRLVIDAARAWGWRVAHFRAAQLGDGRWVTPVAADGAGFPDLVLVHARHAVVAFVELKSETGDHRPEQRAWLDDLGEAMQQHGDVWVATWRPRDERRVMHMLQYPRGRR